jgi:hypothetical protein
MKKLKSGLTDRLGKEICEGDIIECKRYLVALKWINTIEEVEQRRKNFYKERSVVKFENGQFTAGDKKDASVLAWGEYFERYVGDTVDYEEKIWGFEVIGNVYETPTLPLFEKEKGD